MDALQEKIAVLKDRAAVFQELMRDLVSVRDAVKQDPQAFAQWQKLMLDGNSIRAAIETTARMVDGAQKWTSKVFQVDALQKIPFAADVVIMTASGAIGTINNFIERAQALGPAFLKLKEKFKQLPKDERERLGALALPEIKQSIVPALILIAVLGGLFLFGDRFQIENIDDDR